MFGFEKAFRGTKRGGRGKETTKQGAYFSINRDCTIQIKNILLFTYKSLTCYTVATFITA